MIPGAWICLAAPLVGTALILLGGTRISRTTAAWVGTTSIFVAFAGALWSFFGLWAHGSDNGQISSAWTWLM